MHAGTTNITHLYYTLLHRRSGGRATARNWFYTRANVQFRLARASSGSSTHGALPYTYNTRICISRLNFLISPIRAHSLLLFHATDKCPAKPAPIWYTIFNADIEFTLDDDMFVELLGSNGGRLCCKNRALSKHTENREEKATEQSDNVCLTLKR